MRRKLLMGVLALALPAGTLAAFSPGASAATPQNPILCVGHVGPGGVVTFGTPLTIAGVATSSKTGNTTTISPSTFNCGGGIANGTDTGSNLTGGKNTKLLKTDPRYDKTAGIKYVTGTWAEFAAAGGSLKKSLKTINFTVNGSGVTFQAKSATLVVGGSCGGDVGFNVLGQVKSGTYADKSANVLACLGSDTRANATHGTFLGDYLVTDNIVTAQLDPATSLANV